PPGYPDARTRARRDSCVIRAGRARGSPMRFVQVHEQPVRVFPERVLSKQTFGVTNRLRMNAGVAEHGGQALEGVHQTKSETVALGQDPFSVESFKKVASVQTDGLAERVEGGCVGCGLSTLERVLEGIDVDAYQRARFPLQRVCSDLDEVLDIGNRASELVKQMPQIGARLRFGRIGPEQECQSLARMR